MCFSVQEDDANGHGWTFYLHLVLVSYSSDSSCSVHPNIGRGVNRETFLDILHQEFISISRNPFDGLWCLWIFEPCTLWSLVQFRMNWMAEQIEFLRHTPPINSWPKRGPVSSSVLIDFWSDWYEIIELSKVVREQRFPFQLFQNHSSCP